MDTEEVRDFTPKSLDAVLSNGPDEAKPETETPAEAAPETPADTKPAVEPAEPDAKPETKPEEPKGEAEGEKPEAKEDAPPASETKQPDPDPETAFKKAMLTERSKRQAIESQLAAVQQQLNQQSRPDPDIYPDEAAEFDRTQQSQSAFQMRVAMSQEMMREVREDYDEVEAVFMDAAQTNPALAAQLANHAAPAKFAYHEGKRLMQINAMGDDPVAYIEQVKAEAAKAGAAAAIAEINKQKAAANLEGVPESLAEAPSATSVQDAHKWQGPKPLSEILK